MQGVDRRSGRQAKAIGMLEKQAKELDALQDTLDAKQEELNKVISEAANLRAQVRVLQKKALDVESSGNTKASAKAQEFIGKLSDSFKARSLPGSQQSTGSQPAGRQSPRNALVPVKPTVKP